MSLSDLIDIAHETGKFVDVARGVGGFLCAATMPKIAVSFPFRRATPGAMHPTYETAAHRKRATTLPGSL